MKFLEQQSEFPPILFIKNERHFKIAREAFRKLNFAEPIVPDDVDQVNSALTENPRSLLLMDSGLGDVYKILNHCRGDGFFDLRPIIFLCEKSDSKVMKILSEFRLSFVRYGEQDPKDFVTDIIQSFNPENPINSLLPQFRQIESARENNEDTAVIELFENLVDEYPQNIRLHTEMAAAKIKMGLHEEAESILDEVLIVDQNSPRVLFLKSQCRMKQGDRVQAMEHLSKSVNYCSYNSQRCSELGKMEIEWGSEDKGKKLFLHAWKIDKKNVEAYKGIATTKLLEGDSEQAIKMLKKISSEKERASAFNLAGVAAVKKKNFHLADKLYSQATEIVKDKKIMAKVIYNQALAAAKLKMKKETTAYLKQVLECDPDFKKAEILAAKLKIDLS